MWPFRKQPNLTLKNTPPSSHLLIHTMFEILATYIDRELDTVKLFNDTIIVSGKEKPVHEEMLEICNWWRTKYLTEYPKRISAIKTQINTSPIGNQQTDEENLKAYNHIWAIEQEINTELKNMMHRLVNISAYM